MQLIFERRFDNYLHFTIIYTYPHFLPIFITYSRGFILWKTSLIINWANIVTASLSVPKLHNSFENLKGFYYFDKAKSFIYTFVPCILHFLNQSYLIWLWNIQIRCFSTFDWPDIELEKQEVNVQPR